ncbi:hypothetical protein TERTU_3108 [Teredinibacter turnerae T7901]|uniref:Uncharacterized protein n=1 Tax=Teredinibacter turnerae (strain ATCC 39867 / T7901) TaxID=377629 RepID=C5BP85_TERTT|nr:hypothetical protein TERTU_3108 [Teredinibacter turnerae T7901]
MDVIYEAIFVSIHALARSANYRTSKGPGTPTSFNPRAREEREGDLNLLFWPM